MLLFTNSKFCKLLLPNKKSLVWVLSLLFVLGNVIQSFGQMARPNPVIPVTQPTDLYSKKGLFKWVFPPVSGSPINDIGHSIALGESGFRIRHGSIQLENNWTFYYNPHLEGWNYPTSLDFKKVLSSKPDYFLAETQNNEIFLKFFGRLAPFEREFFWRKAIPASLIPYQVIGFQSVGKGYIIKNNTLYISSDSATTWQEMGTLPFEDARLLYSYNSNQLLIINRESNLNVSNNNGVSFATATGITGNIKHLESTNGRLIFATTSNGFFTSNDSGRVWQSIPNIPAGNAKYICPINNHMWYFAIDNRIYRTLDSGITFIQHSQIAPDTIKIIKPMTETGYHILLNDGRYYSNYINRGNYGVQNLGDNFAAPFFSYYDYDNGQEIQLNESKIIQTVATFDSIYNYYPYDRQVFFLNSFGKVTMLSGANTINSYETGNTALMSNKGPKWKKKFNGKIYCRNNIFDYNLNQFQSDSTANTFPTAKKLIHLGNKLLVFEPNRTSIPFLPAYNIAASLDSLPFVVNDPLVDLDADTNRTNDTIFGLCASGNVYIQKTIGNTRVATLLPNRRIVPKQLALGVKVRGITRKVGVLDTSNHIYAGAINGNRLRQITGNLNMPVLDFVIVGDSVFVLSTKNRYYVTALSDTLNYVWQSDSIHSTRSFSKLSIDQQRDSAQVFGRSQFQRDNNPWIKVPSILFMGSGNSVISTSEGWFFNITNTKTRKHIAHLNIYPNPTVNKTFRISETGIKQLVLSDLQGRRLATLTPDASDELTFTVLGFIANGYYLLNGVLNGKTYTGKLMIK